MLAVLHKSEIIIKAALAAAVQVQQAQTIQQPTTTAQQAEQDSLHLLQDRQ
jgi:hypothetical protein